ncbi:MAG: 50S ribosomal protein L3, partial [Terriglobia bacterium]
MAIGLLGRKVGMTQVFDAAGTAIPVTVIEAGPCPVLQLRTAERDGYEAVQLGLVDVTAPKANQPTSGHFKKAGVPPTRVRREVGIKPGGDAVKAGDSVLCSIFTPGERVDVIGTSRGRGFQGVVKRHHFRGGDATHGSMFHRAPGSIGASSYPSRVVKGMRGPGRMGADRVTTRNLKVVTVDAEQHLLVLRGAVPGAPDGIVIVR